MAQQLAPLDLMLFETNFTACDDVMRAGFHGASPVAENEALMTFSSIAVTTVSAILPNNCPRSLSMHLDQSTCSNRANLAFA